METGPPPPFFFVVSLSFLNFVVLVFAVCWCVSFSLDIVPGNDTTVCNHTESYQKPESVSRMPPLTCLYPYFLRSRNVYL